MFTRFLTYDLQYANTDEYEELYDLIDKYKGERITESTYKIRTSDSWDTFKQNFKAVTHSGDNVKAIVLCDKAMEVRTIR